MKNVLVTGANGLLACNTIIELLNNGYYVKGLLRDINKYVGPTHKNLTLVKGNILSTIDMDNAILDCQFVIHIAALTDQNRTNYKDYEEVNVEGSKNVIESSIRNNIKKLVYVSSANVFGYGDLLKPGDETRQIKAPFSNSLYAQSKLASQFELLKYADRIETTIVNPTFMIGPYDSKPSSGRIVLMGVKKRFVFCPPGGKNFVSVLDAAKGVVNALTTGHSKESYILANENLSYVDFFKRLRGKVSRKFIIIKIPKLVLISLGYVGNAFRVLGIKTDVSLNNMKTLCINNYYSNQKSVSHLGLKYEPIESSIEAALEWFKNK